MSVICLYFAAITYTSAVVHYHRFVVHDSDGGFEHRQVRALAPARCTLALCGGRYCWAVHGGEAD